MLAAIYPDRNAGGARWTGAVAVAGLGLLAAACQGGGTSSHAAAAAHPPAKVTITTGNLSFRSPPPMAAGQAGQRSGHQLAASGTAARSGAGIVTRSAASALVDNRPDLGIDVSVTGGRLTSVRVTGGSATAVPGSLGAGGTDWHTDWALAPSSAYHVTATAVNQQGRETVATGTFRTLNPRRTFRASTTLTAGQVYGVGMPIMVTFSRPITDKAEVERSLEIWASKPVTGAWYWMSSTEVWFRPRQYWPAHTRVRLEAHLRGVQGAHGVYGRADLAQHFRIGNSLVVVASTASHHMKVWWQGHLKGDWPISTGQPGLDTPDGHYLSFAMGNPVDMNSATFGVMPGDPGYYNVMVYDSVQFTADGDYVHSAPWSVGEQGYVNVSHGCVNVAPGNAAWYYGHSLIGDPISVVGSPAKGIWGDGWTIWFLNWHKLLAGSGTGQQVMADSSGSQFVSPRSAMPAHARGARTLQY